MTLDRIVMGTTDKEAAVPETRSKAIRTTKSIRPDPFGSSPPRVPAVGLGLTGIQGPEEPSSGSLSTLPAPTSGPSYFDITPSSISVNSVPSHPRKSTGFTTKTPGRRAKRTPAHSISSTITNGGSTTPRRISCANMDTASQNSASYLDEQDVEIDENSFYAHLQKMQERYLAQQEPGWLRTQHAILQAKHKIPGPGSHHHDSKGALFGKKSSLAPGPQPFLSRIQSGSSSPSGSEYSSSPSFYPPLHQQRLPFSEASSPQRHQPIQPFNCFQPGNVICVPRERSLGGLSFHKRFVETHILTPSPYFRGQYLTLDHKVVEIDKEYVREISGFANPRSVQILSEETVYNGTSPKPTRVLVLDRPLEGDGVVMTRPLDGPVMPSMRQFTSDMAFLESFPELNRALRDFNNLCQEFENTYVYIRGFAAYTLDKLRLIYEKAYRDCLGDSVKLQKMLMRGVQAEQDCFAELVENVVLGKLYHKLYIRSLIPCYAQRDIEVDKTIARYHRYLFSLGGHRGIDGGACLASTDGPLLQEALRKLGLSEKMQSMRVDHALEGAAGLFRAWDQENDDEVDRRSMSSSLQETEQERKRRQLRESLRVFVQDSKPKADKRSSIQSHEGRDGNGDGENEDDDEDEGEDAVWNTPLEKVHCIKRALDVIAAVAEDHLMNGHGAGFVQKKRSEVSVTTDDFIPLLAIAIVQARMMRLGSNLFYLQRFRINTPKSDMSFALVTFEASVEFLKTDPLGLLGPDQSRPSSSIGFNPVTTESPSTPHIDVDINSPTDDTQLLPWGTPSHTGWGFSPPKASSFTPALEVLTPRLETSALTSTSAEPSPSRPPLATGYSYQSPQQSQPQRHSRSTSMNIDDRFRRMTHAEDAGSGSSNNSSWSRSPMLGPRFMSGANSPLGATSPTYGVGCTPTDTTHSAPSRRRSHQLQPSPQRHSISNGQAQMFSHSPHFDHHRISLEQGRETMNRSTFLPLQSPHMTPQLVVKPQIMLPPPTTPPMSGQNTSGRARPMSMIVVGGLASSGYSSSYTGPGGMSSLRNKSYTSNQSSPATSPRLGAGSGNGQSSSRSNSLLSGSFPMFRANSMVTTTQRVTPESDGSSAITQEGKGQAEPLSPVSPSASWTSRDPSSMSEHPVVLTESPVISAASTSPPAAAPTTAKGSRSRPNIPNRIQTSPSSTTSSISTPTTPSTFSATPTTTLLNSLSASAQLATPSTGSLGPAITRRSTIHTHDASSTSASGTSSAPGSVRSRNSSLGRKHSMRISLPKLAPSPSAPSTAFSRTTVTAATNATTRADVLEPSSASSVTDMFGISSPSTSSAPMNVMSVKSAPEVPTLASLGRSGSAHHVRARSPAISMTSSPFAFSGLGRDSLPSPVTPQSPLNERNPKSLTDNQSAEEQSVAATESPILSAEGLSTSLAVEEPRETTSFMSASKASVTSTRPVIRAPSLKSPPLAKSTSSSPSYTQLQFQFSERYTAPEIITLASPLTGSIVTPRQNHIAVPSGRMSSLVGGSSYTPSFQDPSSRGSSLSSSHLMRRSLDGSRPSTSQGCYGSHGNGSSFGSTPPGSEAQLHFPYYPQSSLPSTPTLRAHAQHPLAFGSNQYHSHSHHPHRHHQQQHLQQHQRQYSESAAPTSYLSSSLASPSYRHDSCGRGVGVSPGSFEAGVHDCDSGDGGANRDLHRDIRHLSFPLGVNDFARNPSAMISRIPEQKEEQDHSETFVKGDGTRAADQGEGESTAATKGQDTVPSTLVLKDTVHVKMDSGKYVGQHSSHSNSASTSSNISVRSVTDHVTHGTAQDFDRSFLEELNIDSVSMADDDHRSRRGSAISLRNAKSLGSFYPPAEKELAMTSSWNLEEDSGKQRRQSAAGSRRGSRMALSNGDLPCASSASSSTSTSFTSRTAMMARTGSDDPATLPISMESSQDRASRQRRKMMGDFLSELTRVEDGDVLIGNGRDGVVSRQ
ncbi:hypothetical protein BGZ75_005748 [Mortierella antarctica]|nr:hypothetical protein BGZ75_005748 [Mortierella antarctica]